MGGCFPEQQGEWVSSVKGKGDGGLLEAKSGARRWRMTSEPPRRKTDRMRERVLGVRNAVMRRRITIKQIAEKAGLSVTTVDRVLKGRRNFRGATALRVQAATEALGYHPAVSLVAGSVQETLRAAVLLQRKGSSTYQHLAARLR